MSATTAAYRGLPDLIPKNITFVGMLAEQNGWTITPTYTTKPPSIVLRFAKPDVPRVWAAWWGGSFWRAYAQNAQRLSLRDLKDVLRDPSMLTFEDADDPFGYVARTAEASVTVAQ